MAYQNLSANEIASGAPLDAALLAKIKNNFEFQQSDLAAKQAVIDSQAADLISKQSVINTVNSNLPKVAGTGEVRMSMLNPTQFAAENLGTWMLMNGQSCAGTNYATITGFNNVPDMRGTVPRMKDHGRGVNTDGDTALGTYQGDTMERITGNMYASDVGWTRGSESINGSFYASGTSTYQRGYQGGTGYGIAFDSARQVRTSNETRMRNLTVNFYIKVGN